MKLASPRFLTRMILSPEDEFLFRVAQPRLRGVVLLAGGTLAAGVAATACISGAGQSADRPHYCGRS